ncbi:MAG: hypothetical protein JWQ44_2192 [Chthoniobacter sp.]|jgi:hypothetical protein|nr:hypothetical protein [Chthoniobacter sp.]
MLVNIQEMMTQVRSRLRGSFPVAVVCGSEARASNLIVLWDFTSRSGDFVISG